MKKFLIFLLLLIPVPVFADVNLDRFTYLTRTGVSLSPNSFSGNEINIPFSSGNLIFGSFSNSQADYVVIPILERIIYNAEKSYVFHDNTHVDYAGVIGALSNVQPSGSTSGNQVKCTEIANFPQSGTSNHYSSCNVSLNANNLSATISTTNNNGDFELQVIDFSFRYKIVYKSGNNTTDRDCEYDNGFLYCPYVKNMNVDSLIIKSNYIADSNLSVDVYYVGYFSFYLSNSGLINNQNQIINNTDTSPNSSDFSNTISNFNIPNDSHAFDILGGLQNFVSGLSVSSSCRRISVPIPFTNQNLVLPCMTTDVYSVHFPEIVVIWQLLVRGLVYYYIIVNILRLIKETIDPFNFKLEVMDL